MKSILILAGRYSSCMSTQEIWQNACQKYNIELEIMDLEHDDGQVTAKQYDLKSFPALIVDEKITAVGHPDKQTAEKIIADLIQHNNNQTTK